jgi:hypothetical protein
MKPRPGMAGWHTPTSLFGWHTPLDPECPGNPLVGSDPMGDGLAENLERLHASDRRDRAQRGARQRRTAGARSSSRAGVSYASAETTASRRLRKRRP